MNVQAVLILAGLGVVSYFLTKYALRGDEAIEERRRRAMELSTWCKINGLPELSKLLQAYTIGGYRAIIAQLRVIHGILSDDEEAKAAIDRFLQVQLDKKIATADGREELVAYVERKLGIAIPRDAIVTKTTELKEDK